MSVFLSFHESGSGLCLVAAPTRLSNPCGLACTMEDHSENTVMPAAILQEDKVESPREHDDLHQLLQATQQHASWCTDFEAASSQEDEDRVLAEATGCCFSASGMLLKSWLAVPVHNISLVSLRCCRSGCRRRRHRHYIGTHPGD